MSRSESHSSPPLLHAVQPTAAAADSRPRRGMRAYFMLGAAVLLALVVIGGYSLLSSGTETTDDAVIEADVIGVTSRVGGVVAELHVRENQRVNKGDLLVTIDDADLAAKVLGARADLATASAQASEAEARAAVAEAAATGGFKSAEAQVSASSSTVEAADAQVGFAQAGLARARAEAQKADADLARMKVLVATGAIAQQQFDNAQATANLAHATVAQAEASLASAEQVRHTAESRVAEARGHLSQSTPVAAQIAAARAAAALARSRVAAAQAALTSAELQLSYARIVAPHDGTVTQIAAREGGVVQAGQPLAHVVPDETYVVANFKETQIEAMRAGNHAEVDIDAYPGHPLHATIDTLSSATGARFSLMPPDNASGNFVKVVQRVPVRLVWDGRPEVPLKAGLSATVKVFVQDRQ
jgi:membrane fusion protein, multidrug efflux system